jgi:methylmalonyl-CoA mutase C-terminal domain/subunit
MMTPEPIRVLVAKIGLDGHDRGAKVVARALRDAGMEVIYTGLHRTPDEVVTAAIQEDVDVLGISCLSGAHMTLVPKVLELLKAAGGGDIPIVVGGVFPDEDVPRMRQLGVAEVVGQDTPPSQVVNVVMEAAALRQPR